MFPARWSWQRGRLGFGNAPLPPGTRSKPTQVPTVRRIAFVLAIAPLLGGACGALTPKVTNDPAAPFDGLTGDEGVAGVLDFRNIRTRVTANDRMEIEGTFIKKVEADLRFRYKMEWYDAAGFRIDDPTQSFEVVELAGARSVTVRNVAAARRIARWRIRVEPDAPR